MAERFDIILDGRPVSAERGAFLLDVIRAAGVQIPTLCHHPSLEPTGACRLCVVEITHPDWNGWSGLVTSCLYPAEPGLEVRTRSDRVVAARRTLLEMLLARCPDAVEVRELAREEGIEETPFPVQSGADKCVLCGLCVRVCQDLGPGAIAPLGRGPAKMIGPRPDRVGEECTGCGACALVCPTDEIRLERRPGLLTIWNREFEVAVCTVITDRCRGCGVCEEVCPVAVPRVVARRDGTLTAVIDPTTCIGCGLCAGACPTGAIVQQNGKLAVGGRERSPAPDLTNRAPVFVCSRSRLPADTPDVFEVPCIGRVPVDEILVCLARGAKGVLLMGRDQATCPFSPGEDQAAARVRVADEIARAAGLGADRVRLVVPPPGREGPACALAEFRASLTPSPLHEPLTVPEPDEAYGMDRALVVARSLLERASAAPELPPEVAALFPAASRRPADLLYLGDLPVLDSLLSLFVKGWRLHEIFVDAARLLKEKGVAVVPVQSAREVRESDAQRVFAFCRNCVPDFGRDVEIVTLAELAGCEETRAASSSCVFRFAIAPSERSALAECLGGARSLSCACPAELAQLRILMREGAWQETWAAAPFLGFSEAVRAVSGSESS
jgi:bidirectional [NiFe] hydrogenase diaphorase subunit